MRATLVLPSLALAAISSAQWKQYTDGYADAYWSKLTGFSTLQMLRYGLKDGGEDRTRGQNDVHVFLRNETFDTHGTDLPFQYSARGAVAGAGYRYWFPGRQFFFTAMAGTGIGGDNKGKSDLRVGFAGFTERWSPDEKLVTDIYADAFYVDRAKDTFLDIRIRPGMVLKKNPDGRFWVYGIGQLYASGKGLSGTENRVEGGLGIGLSFAKKVTLNAEARYGYSFRGVITKTRYFNPVIYIAGNL